MIWQCKEESSEVWNLRVLCRKCHFRLEGNTSVRELINKWLTPEEAAERAGVKPATVLRWCKHELRYSKQVDGKWLISDVDLFRRKARDRGWVDMDGHVHWKRTDTTRATSGCSVDIPQQAAGVRPTR